MNGNPVNAIDPSGLTGETLPGPVPLPIPPVAIPGTPENDAFVDSVNDLIDSVCEEKPPETCASKYPDLKQCSYYQGKGYHIISKSKHGVQQYMKRMGYSHVKIDKGRRSYKGPCSNGMHYRMSQNGNPIGSCASCPCCEDTPKGPKKTNIWRTF